MPKFTIENNSVTHLDLGGHNELRWCRHGPMLYNQNDEFVGRSLKLYGEFSHAEYALLALIVKPGDIVIDVGANIGAHTVPLAKLVGRDGKVYAFEPQRLVFQTLCANLAINQIKNTDALPFAVGAHDACVEIPMYDPDMRSNFGGVAIGAPKNPDEAGVPMDSVDQTTIDAFIYGRVALIKIDVEGMENDVLIGAAKTIKESRPALYVENDRRDQSETLVARLREMGYDLYWHLPPLFNPANFAHNPENVFPNVVSVNMLCLPHGVAPPVELAPVKAFDELWGTVLPA